MNEYALPVEHFNSNRLSVFDDLKFRAKHDIRKPIPIIASKVKRASVSHVWELQILFTCSSAELEYVEFFSYARNVVRFGTKCSQLPKNRLNDKFFELQKWILTENTCPILLVNNKNNFKTSEDTKFEIHRIGKLLARKQGHVRPELLFEISWIFHNFLVEKGFLKQYDLLNRYCATNVLLKRGRNNNYFRFGYLHFRLFYYVLYYWKRL